MDAIALIGRLVLALAVVLGAMWLLARVAQKRGRGGARRGQVLTVLARQSVSRNSTVAVVRVMDRAMILGVTDARITLLGDADLRAVEEATAPSGRHAAPEPIVIDDDTVILDAVVLDAAVPSARPSLSGRRALPGRTALSGRKAFSGRKAPAGRQVSAATVVGADGLPVKASPLAGSALSSATWKQTVDALRDRTVRRA